MADDAAPGVELAEVAARRLRRAAIVANTTGALDVFLFVTFLVPFTARRSTEVVVVNAAAGIVYLVLTLWLGARASDRRFQRRTVWLREGRPATEAERDDVLRQPLDGALTSMSFWAGGAVLFAAVNAFVLAPGTVAVTAVTFLLAGLTTAALFYLLAERIMRPIVARALAAGPPARPTSLGVSARLLTAWTVATGVPLLGIAALALSELASPGKRSSGTVEGATLFLVAIGLGVGLLAIVLAARSVADPLAAVRRAAARVEAGDYEARVPVDDASEVGLLEAGFNRMAAGLGERERLRDLFGRHVGEEVARAAMESGARLGGEERQVAALFVDLVGSTALAVRRPPSEVVELLNRFFRAVVETVEAHGGLVNKFQGDAALCVFGAPVDRPAPAADALAAARDLRRRLGAELPDVDVGIGVSAGTAVAGNVGAERRFEYTVIGDPVNEAARLCDLAKQRPERLLASEAAVRAAGPQEAARWAVGEPVVLRGRDEATRLATAVA
ncbi:MAG: adenylate cyclase [Solirubrobacteraceae bacterium]|jgi:adenylate cyclase|nr:adenylate cyclase [Solirubrobacteraceae bacterium]